MKRYLKRSFFITLITLSLLICTGQINAQSSETTYYLINYIMVSVDACEESANNLDGPSAIKNCGEVIKTVRSINPRSITKTEEKKIAEYYKRALVTRATIYKLLEEYSLALADYKMLIEADPDPYFYGKSAELNEKLGNINSAISDYSEIIKQIGAEYPHYYYRRAALYIKNKLPQQAIADYSSVIDLRESTADPEYVVSSYLNRLKLYANLGNLDLAAADAVTVIGFVRALPSDSSYNRQVQQALPGFYQTLAQLYHRQKKYDLAVTNFTITIQAKSDSPAAYHFRGHSYNYLGKLDLAVADFTKALELSEDASDLYFDRAATLSDLRKYESALADLNHHIQLKPKEARGYQLRAWINCKQGNKKLAAADEEILVSLGEKPNRCQ